MYITLDTLGHVLGYHDRYLKIDLSNLPKPDFMPTKLVRISDMAVVSGSDVNEGYCALSYSWNQSGEILCDEATEKYKKIDEGKHKIISYDSNMCPDMIIPAYKSSLNDKLKKIYTILNIMEENNYFFTKTSKYVKFEGIIQYICQQCNIKYIWVDQMCINQDDKEEKHREIRNMHHIYGNAHCSVALIPDYQYRDKMWSPDGEEYFKRLWTLEEAIKPKRLLFVGSSVYIWLDHLKKHVDIKIFNKPLSKISVAQILYHAHQRTSTKEHDRVFALIHLFPEFMEHINIDYDQPLEDLMIQFYGLLAKKDLSILLFGNTKDDYTSTIQKYKFLPSWTGVNGKHITDDVTISFQDYDIIGKTMHITSKFVMNGQRIDSDALTVRIEDLPHPPGDIDDEDDNISWHLCIGVQVPGTSETIKVSLIFSVDDIVKEEERCLSEISNYLKQLSRFMETKKENMFWCYSGSEENREVIYIDLKHLTEDVDDLSAQYFILSEVSFENEYCYRYYPVIKKNQGEEYYKAIGFFKIDTLRDIFSGCNLPKQTFSIQ